MSPHEAQAILLSLAHGNDPQSGQPVDDDSLFQQAPVIRALFMAVQALNIALPEETPQRAVTPKTKAGKRENAGARWDAAQDHKLLDAFDNGESVNTIATRLGRTRGAITSRLVKLGRIDERDEALPQTDPADRQALPH